MVRRGRTILEKAFGEEGWRTRAEALKTAVQRRELLNEQWKQLGLKDRYIALLAEASCVAVEEARQIVITEGFDQTLDEWESALERGDHKEVVRIQLSDWRFGLELDWWKDEQRKRQIQDATKRWLGQETDPENPS